jgi:hypothetical protein
VAVRGLLLERDFPAKARDWDVERNTVELATVAAGSNYLAAWRATAAAIAGGPRSTSGRSG